MIIKLIKEIKKLKSQTESRRGLEYKLFNDSNGSKKFQQISKIDNDLFAFSPIQLFTFKKTAFTLAEVLITLAIIGVVASLTIPNVIKNYKVKQLEIAFKRTDAMIQEALKMSFNELGYTDIRDLGVYKKISENTEENKTSLQRTVTELNDKFLEHFKDKKELPRSYLLCTSKGIKQYNFLGEDMHAGCSGGALYMDDMVIYMLPNGVSISGINYAERGGWSGASYFFAGISVYFDTNGPYKGPNRIGYDIFTYVFPKELHIDICNPAVNNSSNYKGCYFFARANQSPLNSSEPYWNLLYKSRSYWENYNK